jgi:hypothetical protein
MIFGNSFPLTKQGLRDKAMEDWKEKVPSHQQNIL